MAKMKKYLLEAADLWDRMRKAAKKQGLPMAHVDDVEDELGYVAWYNEDEEGVVLELETDLRWRVRTDDFRLKVNHGSENMYDCVKHIKQLLEELGIVTGNK